MRRAPLRVDWVLSGAAALLLPVTPFAFPLPSSLAAALSPDEVVRRVEATCARTNDLSAQFLQTVSNRSLGQVREGRGTILLKRPRRIRWEYEKPEPRLFVTNGRTLWDYSPLDKQVRIEEFGVDFSSRLPMSLLAGDCQLRGEFAISAVEHAGTRASGQTAILDLKPRRGEAGVSRVLLEVSLLTYTVEKTTVFDAAGNATVLAFSNLTLNPGLRDDQFEFTPPAGVTVVTPPKR